MQVIPNLEDELLLLKVREDYTAPATTATSYRAWTEGEGPSLLGEHTRTGVWRSMILKVSVLCCEF